MCHQRSGSPRPGFATPDSHQTRREAKTTGNEKMVLILSRSISTTSGGLNLTPTPSVSLRATSCQQSYALCPVSDRCDFARLLGAEFVTGADPALSKISATP